MSKDQEKVDLSINPNSDAVTNVTLDKSDSHVQHTRHDKRGKSKRGRRSPVIAHGVLLIDKPKGLSSFDVIRELRRATGVKKMGHTGTLDPMATGLLVICLGEATKLVPYLTADDKGYEAEVTFGVTTDTYDAEGDITHQAHIDQLQSLRQSSVVDQLTNFMGAQLQRPPAFSAIRVNGERLYDKARRGEKVDVPLRSVTFHHLELTRWSSVDVEDMSEASLSFPKAEVTVICSKGTYIRSLAFDLGAVLGCGAHLSALRRTQAGHFKLNEAHDLKSVTSENLSRVLTPLAEALPQAPKVTLNAAEVLAVQQGKVISAPNLDPSDVGVYRGISTEGRLIALLKKEGAQLKVARGFKG